MSMRPTLSPSAFASDLIAGLVIIVVPYGLAVFVQDVLATAPIPLVDAVVLTALGCGGLALMLGLLRQRRRHVAAAEPRSVDHAVAMLPISQPDRRAIEKLAREVRAPIRHLVTALSWLERSPGTTLDRETRRQLERVRARAEHVMSVLRSATDQPRSAAARIGRLDTRPELGTAARISHRSAPSAPRRA